MLADVCVEHGYEVSLYRHSAFFTIILVFFLCHCPAFLVYVIVRFFLFMSFPDALLFQSLPDIFPFCHCPTLSSLCHYPA